MLKTCKMQIRFANQSDLELVHQLAHSIWPQTYKSVLSREQIEFMLEDMYSVKALAQQINEGATFILLEDEEGAKGFASFSRKADQQVLFVHKLYILPQEQGNGYGKSLINFIVAQAREKGIRCIELNVNRKNTAVEFYQKMGFLIKEEVNIPYHRYILNDFVMKLDLEN